MKPWCVATSNSEVLRRFRKTARHKKRGHREAVTGEELRSTGYYTPAFARLGHVCVRAGQQRRETESGLRLARDAVALRRAACP